MCLMINYDILVEQTELARLKPPTISRLQSWPASEDSSRDVAEVRISSFEDAETSLHRCVMGSGVLRIRSGRMPRQL